MTQFAITDGTTLTRLVNAETLESAVNIYIKRIIRDEYGMQKNSEGKMLTTENLQACYEDWADTMIENMQNDGYEAGKYIINMDDMADNWSNRYWIVTRLKTFGDWTAINNSLQYKMIKDVLIKKGVTEKEYEIQETA